MDKMETETMREEFLEVVPHSSEPSDTPTPARIDGVVIGMLVDLPTHEAPLVTFPGNPEDAPLPARATSPLAREDIGREVAMLFESGDPGRPLIIGRIHHPVLDSPRQPAPNAEIDHERLVLTADKEIVLRCGKASITLTRAGKILIRGAYLLSRSSGVNRIKGGSVQLN